MGYQTMSRRAAAQKSLPYDAEVEYIVSDGNQYIDTGIKVSGNLIVKIKTIDFFDSVNSGKWAFGGRIAYLNNSYGLYIDSSTNNVYYQYGNQIKNCGIFSTYSLTNYDIEFDNGVLKIGNKQFSLSPRTFAIDHNLFLFALNNNGNNIARTLYKCAGSYITNGSQTLNLIPVRKNGVGYLYDKISGRLLGDVRGYGFGYGSDI